MNFFKKIFGKNGIKESLNLDFKDCKNYIKENGIVFCKIKEVNKGLKQQINEIGLDLKALEKSSFEKDADKIIMSRVEDNRKAYIKQVQIFLRKIAGKELNFDNLDAYIEDFEDELSKLGKNSFRSFLIMENIFKKDARKVAVAIKRLDNFVKDLKKLKESKEFELTKNSFSLINQIHGDKELENKTGNEFYEKSSSSKELSKNIEKLHKEIADLKNNEEYKRINELQIERKKIEDQIRANKSEVVRIFYPIQRIMRKFQRIEPSKIIEGYLDSALLLFKDENLKIFELIKRMEMAVISNKIDLKEDKKEKSLSALKEIKESELRNFLSKNKELDIKLIKIDEDLNASHILKDVDELRIRLSGYVNSLSKINSELETLETKKESLSIDELKNKLESNLFEIFDREIKISS